MTTVPAPLTLAVHTVGRDRRRRMAEDVRRSLGGELLELPCRYLYDERGSRLFEEITRLPEYYLTRAEREILEAQAAGIIEATRPASIVELGAGSCEKTRLLLAAGWRDGCLRYFVPFDISETVLWEAAWPLVEEFEGLSVYGMVGDFDDDLHHIPRLGRQLLLFLGSTIGNFDMGERVAFLRRLRGIMAEEDYLLLGVDLMKDVALLQAAYDDAAGITAEFNRNLLLVLNRELGADFVLDAFEHVARVDRERQWVEMFLRSRWDQVVKVRGAALEVRLRAGDMIRTEISAKFTQATVMEMLDRADLALRAWFTDEQQRFALALAALRAR
ncbi:MAG TPA: L-histidine N(alpha)-methyltransferase [Candidatus Dormibacteraeota bacterium]|nr:L-histidine N(alpha)-methyltransferase [Candidatus Dormibacteraeota bacterium]